MIITETISPEKEGGWTFIKTYSSIGMMIRQDETGNLYSEAIDPDFTNRTYTETNQPIDEDPDESETEAKAEAYDILMGVSE